jgi:hypothetical protein
MSRLNQSCPRAWCRSCELISPPSYFFATLPDERYDRVIRIVERMDAKLNDVSWTKSATKINGIKYPFHHNQAWTLNDAQYFARAAHARLLEA